MDHLSILYNRTRASVLNHKSKRVFFLGEYSTIEKAMEFAPRALDHKINNPSTHFKEFLKSE